MPETTPSSALVESIRKGLSELESIGEMRSSSNYALHQFHEHMQGRLLESMAQRMRREIDQIEKEFNV